ncbi:MAG TPA: glycoside hydrolase family 2 [Lachnospiraceae bacterium]|nr:glycoside hydrolase family 2 [Lachnospiraceae bacterium]
MKQLFTRWGRVFNREEVLPEYPRPWMKRNSYVNLNGEWQYAFTGKEVRDPSEVHFKDSIIVPYSPEAFLSGVGRQLMPDENLWYRRIVNIPEDYRAGKRLLINFGAVDQRCLIYVNRIPVGRHSGGYLPFTVDITEQVDPEDGLFELIVLVRDMTEASYHSRGKQLLKRGGMFYTAQSGIWQTVWAECVPGLYIRNYRVTADILTGRVGIAVTLSEDIGTGVPDWSLKLRKPFIDPISDAEAEACKMNLARYADTFKDRDYLSLKAQDGEAEDTDEETEELSVRVLGTSFDISFRVPERRLWSPEEPYLYYFRLKVCEDEICGYFAFREFSVERPEDFGDKGGVLERLKELKEHPRICLNHSPFFQNGVLDQGYYPEGLYTPPADLALIYDILKMKELGFNMLRKHLKIEADRFYYHCDRIGMTVWQDMVNGGSPYRFWFVTYLATAFNMFRYRIFDNCYSLLSRKSRAGRREFEREMLETAGLLSVHPCISTWVIFNEGWGQFDAVRLTERLRHTDPTRLIDSASGWFDQGCGDLRSQHYYYMKLHVQWCFRRATVLSEYGGFPLRTKGHMASDSIYGYNFCKNSRELNMKYRRLMREVIDPEIRRGLSAIVYTQLSDIEDEANGILTYDREVLKLRPETFAGE